MIIGVVYCELFRSAKWFPKRAAKAAAVLKALFVLLCSWHLCPHPAATAF
jgi:hypothetical protein